jgi:hypothetical protein
MLLERAKISISATNKTDLSLNAITITEGNIAAKDICTHLKMQYYKLFAV